MAMYSRDGVMSLGCLCRLVLRALHKIFTSSSGLLTKTFQSDDLLIQPANVGNGGSPELPQEILMDIFALLEVLDLVRAGSVCSSWHAAYTRLCSTGPCRLHQTPCLLYTSESSSASDVGLYSLAEKKAYRLTLPDPPIQSRHIIGSSYGWIITVDERCEVHLLNPITSEQISLPPVTTIEQVKPIFDDAGSIQKYEYAWYTGKKMIAESPSIFVSNELRDYLFNKAFLSDPSTGDFVVVLIHNPHSQLSFARAGDDKWTWLPPHRYYEDCLFQGGFLYASTSFGEIHAFDLGAPTFEPKILLDSVKDYLFERIYIMKAPCGELLQIWRSSSCNKEDEYDSDSEYELDDESRISTTSGIKVHKVDLGSKNLVEVSGLSEHVLFVGRNQSHCLLAEDYPQLKPNQAYFTDDDYLSVTRCKNDRRDIGVFDMENNSKEEIVFPQTWSNSPTPVWLVPNPRRMNLAYGIRY